MTCDSGWSRTSLNKFILQTLKSSGFPDNYLEALLRFAPGYNVLGFQPADFAGLWFQEFIMAIHLLFPYCISNALKGLNISARGNTPGKGNE